MYILTDSEKFIVAKDNKGNLPIATMAFATMEPIKADGVSDDDFDTAKYYLDDFIPGEVFKHFKHGEIVLGPQRDFTHLVSLRGYGNPDFQQYADIAPKKLVMVCGLEEASKVYRDYQVNYDLGGGNCGPQHGIVYAVKDGKKGRKIGQIYYNGTFRTNAEVKEMDRKFKEALAKSK